MSEEKYKDIADSLSASLVALVNAIKKLSSMAPLLIISLGIFMYLLVKLAIAYPNTIYFVLCPVVLLMALFLYGKTKSYGEASLALTAGLFAVFGINWNAASLFGVIGTWFFFSVLILFVSCIRAAMYVEDITLQAAIKFAQKHDKEVDKMLICKFLDEIRKSPERTNVISSELTCEVFKYAAFKNVKLEHVELILRFTSILHTISKAPVKDIALVGCDIISCVNPVPSEAEFVIDTVYMSLQNTPASPLEYFTICSQAILISKRYNVVPLELIEQIPYYFLDGYSNVHEFVKSIENPIPSTNH